MGKYLIVLCLFVLFLGVICIYVVEKDDINSRLSDQQRVAFAKFRENVDSLLPGDFVSFNERSGECTTYMVIDSPNANFGEIWLKGPGPGSNVNKMQIRVLHSRNPNLALEDFFQVTSIVRQNEEGWRELATWNALQ